MEVHPELASGEVRQLQRCINDLISLLALPAIWSGGDPSQVLHTLLDALMRMLRLDLVSVRLTDPLGEAPVEIVRFGELRGPTPSAHEICEALSQCLTSDSRKWPPLLRNLMGEGDVSIVPLLLGLQGELGAIVAAAERTDFPRQTEILLLSVAANQASIGLQEARLLSQHKRLASELDRRVVQRTAELATANEELKKELAERKRAEQELQRSEAFLAEAQHLSRIGSFSWRVATDEVTWSEQLYRIFQIDRDAQVTFELIGTRIHPEDLSVFQEQIERSRRDGSDVRLEFRLQMPDGAVKYVHVAAHTRGDQGELEYIGAVQDVTERRSSEEALSKARSELSHVARVTSLGVLTASIAHEVNQPLSGIVTNASTCLRMLAADPPNVDGARETARRTIRDGNRASEVITRLRALYGKKEPTIESVDLNEATREVIALSLSELQRNQVILRLDLADDLPVVPGDRVQLQQVILNLIRNGSDAMSSVDDRPRQLLIRTERDEGDRVSLTVQDVGNGFDPQAVDRLFEGFYTTKNDGMGIGLSVSRSIIESHHGRLRATLNNGPGAAFSFSIARAPEATKGAESNRAIRTPDVTDAA
jgi:signal transduction histidine kinase